MTKCRIQWVDKTGKPTPDDNEAVATVYREAYQEMMPISGRIASFEETEKFPICKNHLERLKDHGMERWHVDKLESAV